MISDFVVKAKQIKETFLKKKLGLGCIKTIFFSLKWRKKSLKENDVKTITQFIYLNLSDMFIL